MTLELSLHPGLTWRMFRWKPSCSHVHGSLTTPSPRSTLGTKRGMRTPATSWVLWWPDNTPSEGGPGVYSCTYRLVSMIPSSLRAYQVTTVQTFILYIRYWNDFIFPTLWGRTRYIDVHIISSGWSHHHSELYCTDIYVIYTLFEKISYFQTFVM